MHRIINFLVEERPYSSKILLAICSLVIGLMIQFPTSRSSPVVSDMERIASTEVWLLLFWSYGFGMLVGVFANNHTLKMTAAIHGTLMWTGLFIYHSSVSGVGPLRAIYIVFGIFSLWHVIVIYEQMRILRTHKIDLTKVANDVQIEYLRRYRKR